jgi:CBS domain-containing protein
VRDIIRKVCVDDNLTTSSVKNADILSSLITIRSNSSPENAADLLIENKIRHLLAVNNEDVNKPVGIVTPMDLTRSLGRGNLDNYGNVISRILKYYRD